MRRLRGHGGQRPETLSQVAARIAVARDAGAQGQALCSFGALEQRGCWCDLREGPYAEPALPAWR